MAKEKKGLLGRLFESQKPAPPTPAAPPPVAEVWPKKVHIFSLKIESKIGDYRAKYRYMDLKVKFDSNSYAPGVPVNLQPDGSAVIFGKTVGTFNAPRIQSMLKDWKDRNEPVVCKLYEMNEDGSGLVYIAFYKVPNYTKERICKVSGTGSAEHQDELMLLSVGDELELEESVDVSGRVEVSDIGYLGSKDSTWALDELNLEFCEATVASVEENDNGKLVLTVRIRY